MTKSLKPSLCEEAAGLLAGLAWESPEPALFLFCAEALRDLAGRRAEYELSVLLARPYLREAGGLVAKIVRNRGISATDMHELAFPLMESLAAVTLETVLKSTQHARPAQDAVLRYFEHSGHWSPDDGTLVSGDYYYRIPLRLARRAGAAPQDAPACSSSQ